MNILRKILIALLSLITLFGGEDLCAKTRKHTVKSGQTLFSIAKAYGVTVEAIQESNPSIHGTSIPAGMVLDIPDATQAPVAMPLVPEVKISTPADRLQVEPINTARNQTQFLTTEDWCQPGEAHWTDGTLNIAVIMPFNLDAETTTDNKAQMRSVEFYEGILMAVDEMQASGRRVQVQAYDLSTMPLYSILNGKSMQEADVVIAPFDEGDVKQIADWGERVGTPVISPFIFSNDMLQDYEHLFQVNSQKSLLYPQLTNDVIHRFQDYTFVFVADSVGNRKSDPYPAHLKQALKQNNISYRELVYKRTDRLMACDSILGLMDKNILFIPVTPQPEAMRRMFSGLQHVKILREARYQLAITDGKTNVKLPKIAMLGYPEWVLNMNDFINYYYDLDVYMFTKFYANPFNSDVKHYYSAFKDWYGKEPMSIMPKYGILGYDIARFFLKALTSHGRNIEERLNGELSDGLQTAFCFDRGAGKGFYNRGFYLVHFTPDSKIEKIVVQ